MSYVAKPAGYFISCACILALCDPAVASGAAEVEHAQQASIVVNADSVIRDHLPPTLFGFNVQHYNFQNDLWDEEKRAAADSILSAMTFFPGAIYRYPGGLVANRFQWKETIGPVPERGLQKVVKSGPARRVLFGVEEFLQFVESVGGQPWYVLNLAGWDTESMFRELPEQTMTESNAELAKLMKASLGTVPRYYQLGNELDRAEYQWPHDKYVQRARSTMAAIQAIDPDARFVAFLRDFDWKYKGGAGNGSVSGYEQFIADVLQGLPSVNNFSLHFYYDDPGMAEKYKQIPWRLNQFQRAIDAASRHREGRRPNVWITEHARGGNLAAGKLME
nr:hypothetical protein [Gammaproteobacteria bacterium]